MRNHMRVYIAAPWVKREEAIAAGAKFTAAGFEVSSRWFYHQGDPNDSAGADADPDTIRTQALEDMEDVLSSDCLVVLNLVKSEGKAVETGIAIAEDIPVISVGPRSNIFQSLGLEVDTVEEAIEFLLAALTDGSEDL